jgi:kynurenine formamidase
MDNTPPRSPRQSITGGPALQQRALPGVTYSAAELGASGEQSPDEVLASLALATHGQLYDLDAGRWAGMPILPVHPPFVLTTYRTPKGTAGERGTQTGFTTELIIGSAHTGTHIDALCHVTSDGRWYPDGNEADHLNDFGATHAEASAIPPFVRRGVLVDVAGLRDVDALPAGSQIGWEEISAALDRQGTALRPGDAVLIRTGYMSVWGAPDQSAHYGAGINLEAAIGLADAGA